MGVPSAFWLEKVRFWVQSGWFVLFGLALWFSVGLFLRPRGTIYHRATRVLWGTAMWALIGMWVAGATLEMMRRSAFVSSLQLVAALAAFSIFLGSVLVVTREWFGPRWGDPLYPQRLALSLLVLTVAGWWFGGLCLEWNALWSFVPLDTGRTRAPDAWALSLGGATLLGAASLVRCAEPAKGRIVNPRPATLWLLGLVLVLAWPGLGQNPTAASALMAGASVFCFKIWRARPKRPLFLRVNSRTRTVLATLLTCLPLLARPEPLAVWAARVLQSWESPLYLLALAGFLAALRALTFVVREPLRLAVFEDMSRRALLLGVLAGSGVATLLCGPAGALFFGFWPLAGLFSIYWRSMSLPVEPTPLPLPPNLNSRLEAQIRFFIEADRLKSVSRRSYITDQSRRENSAEHSWHFALGILLLREYGGEFDVFRALKMAIIHDIVEIDAGDTFVYDQVGVSSQSQRERAAADRLFGMLPADQETEFRAIWDEFESGTSREARFALAVDRFCPLILNYSTSGRSWRENGVSSDRVRALNVAGTAGAPDIQKFIGELIDFAVAEGILQP